MAHVIVEELAQGAGLTKEELERELIGVHRHVVRGSDGFPHYAAGGEAIIWRAGINGEYAIKAFREGLEGRAKSEYDKLQKLRESKYVPRAYGLGVLVEDDGVQRVSIVEEFVIGTSLAEAMNGGLLTGDAKRRALNAERAALIALELARGVRDLHRVGLAHRDISLANIILSEQCVREKLRHGVNLRLVDFGSSTSVERTDVTVIGEGVRLASIPFGAPEMFGGKYYEPHSLVGGLSTPGRNSVSTDVWSIGAIIASLVSGEEYWPPKIEGIRKNGFGYTGDKVAELREIADAKSSPIDIVPLLERTGGLGEVGYELAEIVRVCTSYDPSLRPSLDRLEKSLLWLLSKPRSHDDEGMSVSPITPDLRREVSDEVAREHEPLNDTGGSEGVKKSGTMPIAGRMGILIAFVIAISLFVAVIVPAISREPESLPAETTVGTNGMSTSEEQLPIETIPGVEVRSEINDYSWSELKVLAEAIATANSDDEGLTIARFYNLLDGEGKLKGDSKTITLTDGTLTAVRIIGFRHDELADGSTAGITFEFEDAPKTHCMNAEMTTAGGWEASEMRSWLNADFMELLSPELRDCIATTRKLTNNTGRVNLDDTSAVTVTDDALWLLSLSEVYGILSAQAKNTPWSSPTYDVEGTQYQLYADQEVSTTNYDFCHKSGLGSWWWLRSPDAGDAWNFRLVTVGGNWDRYYANSDDGGVSPCFCF